MRYIEAHDWLSCACSWVELPMADPRPLLKKPDRSPSGFLPGIIRTETSDRFAIPFRLQRRLHRLTEGVRPPRRNDEPSSRWRDEALVVPHRRGDDRQPAGQRLEDRVAAPFIIGRQSENVRGLKPNRNSLGRLRPRKMNGFSIPSSPILRAGSQGTQARAPPPDNASLR